MKNTVKAAFYAAAGSSLLALNTVSAIDVKVTKSTTTGDNSADGSIVETLDTLLGYLIGLLYFIALAFALYAGFQILTAGGDEEKVKKGKTTLINALIGLFLIFIASQLVGWIIGLGGSTVS